MVKPYAKLQGTGETNEMDKMVQELRQVKEKLRRSEEMYRFLTEHSIDVIWCLDAQLNFVYASPAVIKVTGYQQNEIVGRPLFSILTPESVKVVCAGYAERKNLQQERQRWDGSTYTVQVVCQDGQLIWAEVTVNPIFDENDQLLGFNGITRDISERLKREELVRQYAFCDPLTKLPNRRSFEERLQQILAQHQSTASCFAVMFLDVDGLKRINDTYGHEGGDIILKEVAVRLCRSVRENDFIARLAGDEFMGIFPGLKERGAVSTITERLLESFQAEIALADTQVSVGVSIGISFFPQDADTVGRLMNYADQAMYKAKKSGGNTCLYYGDILAD